MNKSPQYNQHAELEQCKSEVDEICLPKPGNWLSLPENTSPMIENPSYETIFENCHIKE